MTFRGPSAARLAGATIGLAAASGCGRVAPVGPAVARSMAPSAAPSAAEREAPTRFWLRLDVPLRGHFEEPWASQAPPRLLVDWFADGTIRAVGRDWPRIPVPARALSPPSRDSGLGLFVHRKTALHVESLNGPVIGWADAGAYLQVLGLAAGATEVGLPDHRGAVYGFPLAPAFVESSALGVAEPLPPPPAEVRADYVDVEEYIAATPEGSPFATTSCGALQVIGREGPRLQVAQSRDGIHVTGWLDRPPRVTYGTHACAPRVVELGPRGTAAPPLPLGYQAYRDEDAPGDPLGPTVRRGGVIVWMWRANDGTLSCDDWRAKADHVGDDLTGTLRRDFIEEGRRGFVEFGIAVGSRHGPALNPVSLTGPSSESTDGSGGVALCGTGYSIVAADATHVTLLRGVYLDGIVGYRPEDTEVWYLSHAACEEARRAAAKGGPLALAARVHHGGC